MSGADFDILGPDEELVPGASFVLGYQPVIDCIHFWDDRCAHPSAQRPIIPNKKCVFTNDDPRCTGCRFQVKHERKGPPGEK